MSGGWYCSNCGALYRTLGAGIITCQRCGGLGLRGYERRPRRVTCPKDGCDFTGWDDGGVNDDIGRHRRREHVPPVVEGSGMSNSGKAGRRSVRELKRGPSHLYQRLLLGEINAGEYARVVRAAIERRFRAAPDAAGTDER